MGRPKLRDTKLMRVPKSFDSLVSEIARDEGLKKIDVVDKAKSSLKLWKLNREAWGLGKKTRRR